jgi:segregation and condensation protein B
MRKKRKLRARAAAEAGRVASGDGVDASADPGRDPSDDDAADPQADPDSPWDGGPTWNSDEDADESDEDGADDDESDEGGAADDESDDGDEPDEAAGSDADDEESLDAGGAASGDDEVTGAEADEEDGALGAEAESDGDADEEAGAEGDEEADEEDGALDADGGGERDAEADEDGESLDANAASSGEPDGAEAELSADPDAELAPAYAVDPVRLRSILESLLFAAEKPLTPNDLRRLTGCNDAPAIKAALDVLMQDYRERGVALYDVAGGYQFRTHPSNSEYVQRLIAGRPVRLSRAQLETLSIIAYRQPVTRPEIDEIRGVDSGSTLKVLLDRSLIRVLGKKEEPGRPLLYGTSKEFLEFFNLSELRDLPTLREFHELTEESLREVEALDGGDSGEGAAADPGDGSHARGEGTGGDPDDDDDASAAAPH